MDNSDKYYRNDLCNLLSWHLQWAGREAEKKENFEDAYREALNFEKKSDWKRFSACIDLFEDTEYAIISAFRYQLGYLGNKNYDFGEKNIRLYGILNAVYLQVRSIIELSKLFYFSKPELIKSQFSILPIYKLRGMAGSHTLDFDLDKNTLKNNKGINKKTSFRIVQINLTKTAENIIVISENDFSYNFNLLEELKRYVDLSTNYLIRIMNHSIESLKRTEDDKMRMIQRMDEILLNMIDYEKINENEEYFKKINNHYKNKK